MKWLIIPILALSVLAGCSPRVVIETSKDVVAASQGEARQTATVTPSEDVMPTVIGNITTKVNREYEAGYDANFVVSAGVGSRPLTISDIKPGMNFIIPFPILNGADGKKLISYYLRRPAPSEVKKGKPIPAEYFAWFSGIEGKVTVANGDEVEVPVMVSIPKDAKLKLGIYEVRAGTMDVTNPGLVSVPIEVTWYINVS